MAANIFLVGVKLTTLEHLKKKKILAHWLPSGLKVSLHLELPMYLLYVRKGNVNFKLTTTYVCKVEKEWDCVLIT